MLITDRFVMINFPKTGSSFARSVLKELHRPKGFQKVLARLGMAKSTLNELLLPVIWFKDAGWNYPNQHGVYTQVPAADRGKRIMTVVRDPLQRMVSAYEFRHWARYPGNNEAAIRARFPHFPDLSFEEFMEMNDRIILPSRMPDGVQVDIGLATYQQIQYYAKDPVATLLGLRPDTDLARDRALHFPEVTYLHTEGLSRELHAFLLEMGYPEKDLAFILSKPKENVTERSRPAYLTPAMVEQARQRDRFFYQLFPEYLP